MRGKGRSSCPKNQLDAYPERRKLALLLDQTNVGPAQRSEKKHTNKKHFRERCLTGFTQADILARHAKICKGINDRPVRIKMPAKGQNLLKFQNYQSKMKVPFVIYGDFESRIESLPLNAQEKTTCTEKTDKHAACGFGYTIARADGKSRKMQKCRQGADGEAPAAAVFLKRILVEEKEIRKALETTSPIVMEPLDCLNFKTAKNCLDL